jgi:hypothetical protein
MQGVPVEHLSVERIEDEKALDALKEEWDSLLSNSGSDTIFLTWEWLEAWWRCFREDERLWLVLVKDSNGEVVGIAPLCLTQERRLGGLPVRCLRFLGDRSAGSEYLDFIVKRGCEEKILKAIFHYLHEQHRCLSTSLRFRWSQENPLSCWALMVTIKKLSVGRSSRSPLGLATRLPYVWRGMTGG